ncbi:hypothetical protein Moror_13978 [Moniliophthora roreri MCA 2997]|uniref:Uncharacterized protein n=2 Tax=Moniliophthora roreri TaxID=221103 RepID=V2X727_MONRO|nr:hypothetical protein Moror_13978 [Moniliophthora roreri MCA 2997]KAI3607355.1 hypothetical protein WG66_005045 [Moniliophthora roreri]
MSSSSTSPSQPPSSTPDYSSTPNSSSNLYLFTFLATLFVLLLISSTIIFRSYILRRRYQQRLQEALASGAILAPRSPGSHRKRFRTRPKLYDAFLDYGGDTWDEIMPASVQPVRSKRRRKQQAALHTPAQLGAIERVRRAFNFHRPLITAHEEPAMPYDSSPPSSPENEKASQFPSGMLQIAVLVSMPSNRDQPINDDGEIPEVVFGVTRLHCKAEPPPPV